MLPTLVSATAEAGIAGVSEPLRAVATSKERLAVVLAIGSVPDVDRDNCSSQHVKA
jgi:hypothetical protein